MNHRSKYRLLSWLCIAGITTSTALIGAQRTAKADLFGGDVAVLVEILMKVIHQIRQLNEVIGNARQTVSILREMNRGVKEVLKLAETAHLPLPKQVYDDAKKIESALATANSLYGPIPAASQKKEKIHYQSGVEGLFLSQDALNYSAFLDQTGERVKSSAIVASQASATRLTAETLGVVLHAISHTNRLQAKSLEISSTQRLEGSTREAARYENYIDTHTAVGNSLKSSGFTALNPIWKEANR